MTTHQLNIAYHDLRKAARKLYLAAETEHSVTDSLTGDSLKVVLIPVEEFEKFRTSARKHFNTDALDDTLVQPSRNSILR